MSNQLPWFSRGDHYWDVLKEKLMCLTQGPEMVNATYLFSSVDGGKESAWIRMDETATDLETDKEYLFFQWFFGVLKKGLVYVQYPVGEEIWTTDKLVPDTAVGEEVAYIDNELSPFLNPHRKTEFFIVKGVTIAFKYYNTEAFALRQKLRFVGAKFRQEEVKVGEAHPLTGIVVTEEEFNKLKAVARPLYMRRIA
jgi:hypothetical protein